jgi:hypothetical protein
MDVLALDYEEELCRHLTDEGSFKKILSEGVEDGLLNNPLHKRILAFARHHYTETGKAPALAVFATEFPGFTFDQPESSIEWTIEKLRHRYKKNGIDDLLLTVAHKREDPNAAMTLLRDRVMEIDRATLSNGDTFKSGDSPLFFEELADAIIQGQFKGVTTGFKDIDHYMGGFKSGGLAFILARPKRKKTFLWQRSFIGAIMEGESPYMVTTEVTLNEMKRRMLCQISSYSWNQMEKGELVPGTREWKDLQEQWVKFDETYGRYQIEMPPPGERTVAAIFQKAERFGASALYISQFAYLEGTKDFYRQDHEKHGEIVYDLKTMAVRHSIPVYVEAQFNRGGDSMQELMDFDAGKVGLTDKIPQVADHIFAIFENRELSANGVLEFGQVLGRSSPSGCWYIQTDLINSTYFHVNDPKPHF